MSSTTTSQKAPQKLKIDPIGDVMSLPENPHHHGTLNDRVLRVDKIISHQTVTRHSTELKIYLMRWRKPFDTAENDSWEAAESLESEVNKSLLDEYWKTLYPEGQKQEQQIVSIDTDSTHSESDDDTEICSSNTSIWEDCDSVRVDLVQPEVECVERVFPIQRILCHKGKGRALTYLVRWLTPADCSKEDSWVPSSTLRQPENLDARKEYQRSMTKLHKLRWLERKKQQTQDKATEKKNKSELQHETREFVSSVPMVEAESIETTEGAMLENIIESREFDQSRVLDVIDLRGHRTKNLEYLVRWQTPYDDPKYDSWRPLLWFKGEISRKILTNFRNNRMKEHRRLWRERNKTTSTKSSVKEYELVDLGSSSASSPIEPNRFMNSDPQNHCQISRVLDSRGHKSSNNLEYLVRWQAPYDDPKYDSWKPNLWFKTDEVTKPLKEFRKKRKQEWKLRYKAKCKLLKRMQSQLQSDTSVTVDDGQSSTDQSICIAAEQQNRVPSDVAVLEVIDIQPNGRASKYLCRWQAPYDDPKFDSWEPLTKLQSAAAKLALQEFRKGRERAKLRIFSAQKKTVVQNSNRSMQNSITEPSTGQNNCSAPSDGSTLISKPSTCTPIGQDTSDDLDFLNDAIEMLDYEQDERNGGLRNLLPFG